jgi:uncharacterized membrane protein
LLTDDLEERPMTTGLDLGMSGGWLMYLALFGSVIAIAWFLLTLSRSDHDRAGADTKAILEERLARGEIDATEYERAQRWLDK